jgi:hypothetical protein
MIILSIRPCGTSRVLLHAVKSYDWDLPALFPIREEGVLRIFIALKNSSPWPGFESATFGSSGQHTNHYTTKADIVKISVNVVVTLHALVGRRLGTVGTQCCESCAVIALLLLASRNNMHFLSMRFVRLSERRSLLVVRHTYDTAFLALRPFDSSS